MCRARIRYPLSEKAAGHRWGIGIEGRTISKQPELFSFGKYERTQTKKRGTRKPPAVDPAALLVVGGWRGVHEKGIEEMVKTLELDFWVEPYSDIYNAERDSMATSWAEDGFAIHVRGEENIRRLTELVEHMKKNDMALAEPSVLGFAQRSGLALAIVSRIPKISLEKIREADLAQQKLEQAVEKTGIEQELREAGKRYYALSPAWSDENETELRFFLNPAQQNKYSAGWYNLDELRQWAKDEGPILKNEADASRKMKP